MKSLYQSEGKRRGKIKTEKECDADKERIISCPLVLKLLLSIFGYNRTDTEQLF